MKLQDLFKKRTLKDYIIYVSILVGGVIIDQITKLLAVKYLIPVGSVPLIKFGNVQVLNLTYVENTGAAFGMLKDAPWVFNSISTIAIIVMLAYLFLGSGEGYAVGMAHGFCLVVKVIAELFAHGKNELFNIGHKNHFPNKILF